MKNIFSKILVVTFSFFCALNLCFALDISNFSELKALEDTGGEATLVSDITLTDDIRFKADIVLDLNGHTINTDVGYTLIAVTDMTIKDTSSGKTGLVTNGQTDTEMAEAMGSGEWQSIQVGSTNASGNVTIESGTYKAKYPIHVANGNLVVNGGTIVGGGQYCVGTTTEGVWTITVNGGTFNYVGTYQAFNIHNGKITFNDGTISTTTGSGIVVFEDGEVEVNGGTISAKTFAISGNGSQSGTTNSGVNAKIKVTGGNLTASNGLAVYAPQINGETTISGGTLNGSESAIEVRAGSLTITGGTFNGNTSVYEVVANGNGSTTTGAAVAVVQHTTLQPITVTISGGTFNGIVPLSEADPQGNNPTNVSVTVTGGTFVSTGEYTVKAKDVSGFISGGVFTHDVAEFVATGYASRLVSGKYHVGVLRTVTVGSATNGTVTVDKTSGLAGEEVTVTATPKEGYTLKEVKVVDSSNAAVTLSNNKFVLPDKDVTVSATFEEVKQEVVVEEIDTTKEVKEPTVGVKDAEEAEKAIADALETDKELQEAIEGKNVTVNVEIEKIEPSKELEEKFEKAIGDKVKDATITEFFDIDLVVKDATGAELGTITDLTKPIELVIMLPANLLEAKEGYTRSFYVIREHEGKIDVIDAKLSEDGKYLTVKSDRFSSYAIAYADEEVKAETPATTTTGSTPKTGDAVMVYIALGTMCVLAASASYITLRKRYNR